MKKLEIILQSKLLYIILTVFIVCFVFINTKIIKYESIYKKESEFIGKIVSVNYSNDKITFILKAKEKLICNLYLEENNINHYKNLLGKKVKLFGQLKDVNNNTIPNTFNYKKYLYNNKIYKTLVVKKIEVLKNENMFYKLKNKIYNRINSYNNNIKSYLTLFLLGDKSLLDSTLYKIYRNNGIWHLFAISGMHINLIIIIMNILLSKVRFKNIIISLFLTYFMFLTNFSASVMRATIFFFLKKCLSFLKISINNKKVLLLTAFIILIFNPYMIYNVGFKYSFLITYAIMYKSNLITGNYFIKILKISFLSFISSIPLSININYEINILSIFLNVIYVPFISLIIFPLSILTFVCSVFSPILEMLLIILESSNNFFDNIKFNIIISKLSLTMLLIYYLLLFFCIKNNFKRYKLVLISLLIFNQIYSRLDNNYNIYFLDIGQGDSNLIISPYKKEVILIDTGGIVNSDYNVTKNTISFLKSTGIRKIDFLILTHGDYDHMGEAINLAENFKVEKVIFNCGEFNELEQELIKVLDKKKIPYYSCIKELNIDNNKLYFLNNKIYDNENDNSSVIYTELNNYKFLFMGDAGVEVEENLLEKYNLQNIDVLKVGHHGSKTSSSIEFIDEINPKYSIISVGKNNIYGHPNKEVLENLKDSKLYRTDEDGSIVFKIKNDKLKIETCVP